MKKKSDMSKLFQYAGKYKYLSIASWILSGVSAFFALVPFIYIWKIIKEVLKVAPDFSKAETLSYNGWMAVLFAVISMLIYIGALMCSHIAAFHVQAQIRSRAMHHIVTLPLEFMDDIGSGKLRKIINECSADTETYLAHQLPDKAGAIATPIGLLILLLIFDWRLGLLSLLPVVIAFIIMSMMTGKEMQQKMTEYQNALAEMSSEAVEYVRGIPVVKTFGQSVFSFKRLKNSIDKYQKWTIAYTKQLMMPMVLYTTIINAVFTILIAVTLIISEKGNITADFLLNLLFYIIITPIITITLNKIMYSSENSMIVSDALKRIDSVMEIKPLPQSNNNKYPVDNSVILDDVIFRYPNSEENALSHISLKINPGEHIALVGPSGSGKSTLAAVVARFFDVTSGKILIGGVDIRDIKKDDLMNTVSFVFQDSKLIKASILENVRMAKKNASREEVMEALHKAQCDDIISKLPNGVDTIIGTNGTYLSGGECQRISIARAILKDAPILILDEATAFADPDNEVKVQAAFEELSKGKTVIMIAHRLSTVTSADCIYVLKDGCVFESGTHNKLVSHKGLYAHMWNEYNHTAKWKVGEKNA
ncbi:ABC transporter ATP-binding protein/permease [Clostridium bornimense]|uniref:ABC transporter ATP-binding protein n=1 Tax=Clostridium bornimense TaxID=1216932 RepID=UPI001C0FDE14|nr:ABC transporter ATP-binding protein [Clostridium bornimense]MBU5315427.1 ABC transporter ATP-binding protein/permease [Clostridium bornimense]